MLSKEDIKAFDEKLKKIYPEAAEVIDAERRKHDPVNHPSHYNKGGVECYDAIKAATSDLNGVEGYATGNAIKYLWRWKSKNGLEDLKKAEWYIKALIELATKIVPILLIMILAGCGKQKKTVMWLEHFGKDYVEGMRVEPGDTIVMHGAAYGVHYLEVDEDNTKVKWCPNCDDTLWPEERKGYLRVIDSLSRELDGATKSKYTWHLPTYNYNYIQWNHGAVVTSVRGRSGPARETYDSLSKIKDLKAIDLHVKK